MKIQNSILIFVLLFSVSGTLFAKKLDVNEKEGIQIMREDEKLAHDVYQFFSEKWELPIFANISSSETRHFEAIGFLMETFEVPDVAKKEPGAFYNPELQHLYDSLTTKGSESLEAALKAGAYIEEVDIADLQLHLQTTENDTLKMVYENLLRASGNHLRAFSRQLSNRNIDYSPVVLEAKTYQTILETPHQKGGGNCIVPQNNAEGSGGKGKMQRHRGRNNK